MRTEHSIEPVITGAQHIQRLRIVGHCNGRRRDQRLASVCGGLVDAQFGEDVGDSLLLRGLRFLQCLDTLGKIAVHEDCVF